MCSRQLLFCGGLYNLMLLCWLRESGALGGSCDLLIQWADAGMLERLREIEYFDHVRTLADVGERGRTIGERYEAVCEILSGPGRGIRQKARYVDLLSPTGFYDRRGADVDGYVAHSLVFNRTVPYLEHVLRKTGAISAWAHSLIANKVEKLHKFTEAYYAGSHGLWDGLVGIGNPCDRVDKFYTTNPELVSERDRGRMRVAPAPKIDRNNIRYRERMDWLFGVSEAIELSFSAVFFPFSFGIQKKYQPLEQDFLDRARDILGDGKIVGKDHPGLLHERKNPWSGVDSFPYPSIPWELALLHDHGWERRLLVATSGTTALPAAKMYFDDEPYVLNLVRLFPELNKYMQSEIELEMSMEIGTLYRNPDRFCIPASWDQAWDFLRWYAESEL